MLNTTTGAFIFSQRDRYMANKFETKYNKKHSWYSTDITINGFVMVGLHYEGSSPTSLRGRKIYEVKAAREFGDKSNHNPSWRVIASL